MLKFFRNIRKKLVSEGNISKYLKYAIGEIILVVIGILIALQINNWSEISKNRDKEIIYLNRITTNLSYDVKLYKSIVKEDSLLIDKLNYIKTNFTDFTNKIKNPTIDLDFLITGYKLTSNRTTIDNLISSGQIEIIRSNFLLEEIFLYYRTAEDIQKGIDEAILKYNREKFGDLILNFTSKKVEDNNSDYFLKLKNSVDFKLDLLQKQIDAYNNQKAFAEKLIDKINKELDYIRD